MISRTISLGIAMTTNLLLVVLFCRALTHPAGFTDFIYKTGIMIFVIEFMSLHSSGMFLGAVQQEGKTGKTALSTRGKIVLFAFYNIMVVAFAAGTGQWIAALYFFISLVGKATFSRTIDAQKRLAPVAAGIAMLVVATFVVVLSASLLADWFPLPAEVRAARPPDQGGLFVNTPQTLMAWGAIYFSLMTICELMIFRKHREAVVG
jgi:hypothetical protein